MVAKDKWTKSRDNEDEESTGLFFFFNRLDVRSRENSAGTHISSLSNKIWIVVTSADGAYRKKIHLGVE